MCICLCLGQESCRDLGHVELGYMTLINSAETAFHQGVDLYAEEQERLIAGAELHASLLAAEPEARRQPVPAWLCGGRVKAALNSSTWAMLRCERTSGMVSSIVNLQSAALCSSTWGISVTMCEWGPSG